MPKKLTETDYLTAYRISFEEMKIIDPHADDSLISKQLSPEEAVIKQDSFDKLSKEARDIVNFILNQPNEILEILSTPKTKKITKNSILKHLVNIFHSKFLANKILKEISDFVKSF
jgi:hypothetical protein